MFMGYKMKTISKIIEDINFAMVKNSQKTMMLEAQVINNAKLVQQLAVQKQLDKLPKKILTSGILQGSKKK